MKIKQMATQEKEHWIDMKKIAFVFIFIFIFPILSHAAFDLLKYHEDYKGFYGDMSLEDVARDAYNRGFHNGEPDYELLLIRTCF